MNQYTTKRLLSLLLAVLMLTSCLSLSAFAEAPEGGEVIEESAEAPQPTETAAEAPEEEPIEEDLLEEADMVETFLSDPVSISVETSPDDPSNEELLNAYVQKCLDEALPRQRRLLRGTASAGAQLTGIDAKVYTFLKGKIAEIAAGDLKNTVIKYIPDVQSFGPWTTQELGVDWIYNNPNWNDDAKNAAVAKAQLPSVDSGKVLSALLADCPYELYWFDKSTEGAFGMSAAYSFTYSKVGNEEKMGIADFSFTFSFQVHSGYGTGTTVTDNSMSSVTEAITTAQNIVNTYRDLPTYDRLEKYRDEICNRVSYNTEAAGNTGMSDKNPWQLIWVFDNDPNDQTKVVCEGYSKAFKYLCDLSNFTDVNCILVSGTMSGGTGAGPHMWNIVSVKVNDTYRNYLVDVTNCDGESEYLHSVGYPDKLFMKDAPQGGTWDTSYTFQLGDNISITYTYDDKTNDKIDESQWMVSIYGKAALELSDKPYYAITYTGTNGTVSGPSHAIEGETVALSLTGYPLQSLSVTPASAVTNNSFVMPKSDVTVTASFGEITNGATVMSYYLTLDGTIGLTYRVKVPAELNAAKAVLSYKNKEIVYDLGTPISGTANEYSFTYPVPVKEIGNTIGIKILTGNDDVVPLYKKSGEPFANNICEHSVVDYCTTPNIGKYAPGKEVALQALVDALRSYGFYALKYFRDDRDITGNTEFEAASDAAESVETSAFSNYGVRKTGDSTEVQLLYMYLTLESQTTIQLQFKVVGAVGDYTFTCGNESLEPQSLGNDLYLISLHNISANNLDTAYTVSVTKKGAEVNTFTCSALSYGKLLLNSTTEINSNICNAMKAMYLYSQAANDYFSEQ